jgi:hypothetical protein
MVTEKIAVQLAIRNQELMILTSVPRKKAQTGAFAPNGTVNAND